MRRLLRLLHAAPLALVLAACDAAPLAPPIAPTASAAMVTAAMATADGAARRMEVPVFQQITDINPCTGEPITITYSGTGSVHGTMRNVIVQSRGDVTTSDGYAGTFDWTFVFVTDHVTHWRTHDAEASDATGQRVVFAVGLDHTTWNDGEPVVSFRHSTGARCVG